MTERRRKTRTEKLAVAADAAHLPHNTPVPADNQAVGDRDVARHAYELYERRGGQHGADWDDWFQAELELRGMTTR
jgi:hypothetical protein